MAKKLIDLTGATVTIPTGWSNVDLGANFFYLNGSLVSNDYNINGLASIQLYESSPISGIDKIRISDAFSNLYYISIGECITFNITGGTDATNEILIQWFIDNNATIEGGVYEEEETKEETPSIEYEIIYNEQVMATFKEGQTVVIKCVGKKMLSDLSISPKVQEEVAIPTDLTGYKVTIPGGFSAESGFGQFDIKGSSYFNEVSDNGYYSGGLITFHVGYYCEGEGIGCDITETTDSVFVQGDEGFGNWGISVNKEENIPIFLFITGGEDVTNPQLIQWLVDNNATFEKTE